MTFDRLIELAMRGALDEAQGLGMDEAAIKLYLEELGWTVTRVKKYPLGAEARTTGFRITHWPPDLLEQLQQSQSATTGITVTTGESALPGSGGSR